MVGQGVHHHRALMYTNKTIDVGVDQNNLFKKTFEKQHLYNLQKKGSMR
jgi:hypothetical protein